MASHDITLTGNTVRLEPLNHRHIPALVTAANADRSLYQWSTVPATEEAFKDYVDAAMSSVAFATVRRSDDTIIGSTRFFEIERWAWPPDHPRSRRQTPDACEIGWTWLTRDAIRTAANTEAKLLMLTHAFETWGVLRVCLHTDARNERSRKAIERIGGHFEGLLRSHRIAADATARDSARYSILIDEWPSAKQRLLERMTDAPVDSLKT
jgi:RimJ/RimL family protein N-acetyltransferase